MNEKNKTEKMRMIDNNGGDRVITSDIKNKIIHISMHVRVIVIAKGIFYCRRPFPIHFEQPPETTECITISRMGSARTRRVLFELLYILFYCPIVVLLIRYAKKKRKNNIKAWKIYYCPRLSFCHHYCPSFVSDPRGRLLNN